MGGEKPLALGISATDTGSPPRGRGKVYLGPQLVAGNGITPAWAGKSYLLICESIKTGDHPRVGGEKSPSGRYTSHSSGSPPRGRGKDLQIHAVVCGHGITPAWAGKSGCPRRWAPRLKDHPRVGGEKQRRCVDAHPARGSPPRGRGKAISFQLGHEFRGITPAWAGKRHDFTPF